MGGADEASGDLHLRDGRGKKTTKRIQNAEFGYQHTFV